MDETNRWVGFSDEELHALAEMAGSRNTSTNLDDARHAIYLQVRAERKRREAKRVSYRGLGVYRHSGGDEYEVLGTVGSGHVVMHKPSNPADLLLLESFRDFEARDGDVRRYEYLGPLSGEPPHTSNCVSRSEVANALQDGLGQLRRRLLGEEGDDGAS